jgi:hypothetical protein
MRFKCSEMPQIVNTCKRKTTKGLQRVRIDQSGFDAMGNGPHGDEFLVAANVRTHSGACTWTRSPGWNTTFRGARWHTLASNVFLHFMV